MKCIKKNKMPYKKRKRQRMQNIKKETTNQASTGNGIQRCNNYNAKTVCFPQNYPDSINSIAVKQSSYMEGLQLWWQTYCTAITYYRDQQNLWRNKINCTNDHDLLEEYARCYETSSEEEEEEEDVEEYDRETIPPSEPIDEEYLKFLEITFKHREELRLRREKEAELQSNDIS